MKSVNGDSYVLDINEFNEPSEDLVNELLEQYKTFSQLNFHFFLHENFLLQVEQIFVSRFFFKIFFDKVDLVKLSFTHFFSFIWVKIFFS